MFIDFRERGRERKHWCERERSIGCNLYIPWLERSNLQPRYGPWLGIKPANFWCMGWCSNQLSHPVRAGLSLSLKISYCTVLTLLVMTWNAMMSKWWDEVRWMHCDIALGYCNWYLNRSTKILITKMFTNWQMSREHIQIGYTEQNNDSCPGWNGAEWSKILTCTQNGEQFKTYKLFISGIFHLMFSDLGNWNHGKWDHRGRLLALDGVA